MDKIEISPSRDNYQREVGQIREEFGNLEQIRTRLNLSRRKICQLLLVDPSAWTRWTRPGQDAPPHIYKALSWYLKTSGPVEEKSNNDKRINGNIELEVQALQKQLAQMRSELSRRENSRPLEAGMTSPRRRSMKWLFLGQVLFVLLLYWMVVRKI